MGNLGTEVTESTLAAAFRSFPSFAKAKVIKGTNVGGKGKGYGFVSFLDPADGSRVLVEMQGAYIGNRPVTIKKCVDDRTVKDKRGKRVFKTVVEPKQRHAQGPPGMGPGGGHGLGHGHGQGMAPGQGYTSQKRARH